MFYAKGLIALLVQFNLKILIIMKSINNALFQYFYTIDGKTYLITKDGEKVELDRKNLMHVLCIKMCILRDSYYELLDVMRRINEGETIDDCSTDIDDMDKLETYWLDGYFTDDDTKINAAKHDQLCVQLDKDGNWS
jgi:hypothetical protein